MASYVIHEPPSSLIWGTIPILVALTPFHLLIRHRTIAYPFEASHGTFLLCSRYLLKFQFERYLCFFFWANRPTLNFVRICPYRVFPSYPIISTVKIPKEERQLHHDALMHRYEEINAMDRPLREEQPRPRRSVRFFVTQSLPPYSPPKSRDEISCSGGELWRPDN